MILRNLLEGMASLLLLFAKVTLCILLVGYDRLARLAGAGDGSGSQGADPSAAAAHGPGLVLDHR
ncbi:hypothetical protein [Sphingosinicella sp. CPCC 101087]|uniref:hypothetical protein n=1 Tax=Sphingosinicella sp. CPCC 101087 TaxID=2497754 RepID=UPI00101CDB5F|nr:hypothetical protein [Sphingosinicella sp. CPCC 101087]